MTDQKEFDHLLHAWQRPIAENESAISSAINMQIVANIVQKRRKSWLYQLYKENVFQPLGMQNTGLNLNKKQLKWLAVGYNDENQPVALSKQTVYPASRGIVSSVEDMKRFLQASIGSSAMSDNVLYPVRMTQVAYVNLHGLARGLGWNIYPLQSGPLARTLTAEHGLLSVKDIPDIPLYRPERYYYQFGQHAGFSAYMAFIPQKHAGIVLLANKRINAYQFINFAKFLLLKQIKMN